MELDERTERFENMCQADPESEMAHFSLAGAYLQAERFADAAASYLRCVELAPGMSKAYQMAAEALEKAGDLDRAKEVAREGYPAAAERGDLMPKNAMGELLQRLGEELPEIDTAKAEAAAANTGFVCTRTGRPGTQMDRPPFKGPVGAWIHENISGETWNAWIGQGTKVINELRLDLSRDADAESYDQAMHEYLGIDQELLDKLRAGASA